MVTSYIRHTLIYILSISPQSAALETFNGAISTSNLFFLLQLASFRNASCVKWSFNSHPSNRVSCSLYDLRIESSILISSARASNGRSRARLFSFFVSFPNSRISSRFSLSQKKLATGFDPSLFRIYSSKIDE